MSSVCFMIFNDIITYLIPNAIFLLIISIYFIYKNMILGIGFVLANLFILLYLSTQWTTMKDKNEEYEKQVNDTEGYLVEILYNIDKIVSRGQVVQETDTFFDKTTKGIDKAYSFYSSTNNNCTVLTVMVYCTLFCSVGYLMYLYYHKKIDITTFITFFTILLLYRDKMSGLILQIPDFIEFIGRSDGVLDLFKNVSDNYQALMQKFEKETTRQDAKMEFHQIVFNNVAFQYDTADTILFADMNVTLRTTDHKIIGVTGLSGNGKSTLAKMILKMYPCKQGTITIDGRDIQDIDADYIRTEVTYVSQNSKLFDKKIIDNMMYGCTDEEACRIHLDEILAYPKIKQLYQKLDIMTSSSGALGEKLSGGQRQVVNLIGGLINPSKILILDEPTNALDPELKAEVLTLISHFKKYKQCIIIITHDKDVHALFDDHIEV